MLDIILEFRKGILFVRLKGELTKKTVSVFYEQVTNVIYNNGIHNTVINLEFVSQIDLQGMNALLYCYELSKKNKGRAIICGIKNEEVKNRLNKGGILNYLKEISSELEVLEKA